MPWSCARGGAQRIHALSLFAGVGVRGEVLDLGTAFLTEWRPARSPVGHVRAAPRTRQSRHQNERLETTTYETGLAVDALHMFDFTRVSIGAGLEVGVSWFAQRFAGADSQERDLVAPMFGPVVQAEVPLTPRLWLRADGAIPTYFVGDDGGAARPTLVSYRFGVTAGMYF